MANQIKQFRYYTETTTNGATMNYPSQISVNGSNSVPVSYLHYVSGEMFANYYPIIQLGIQSLPGTKFYLNESAEPVIVGQTGIYELDLGLNTKITNIKFDTNSMKSIKDNSNAFLIVDFIYDDKGLTPKSSNNTTPEEKEV